jgi:hypothetical protein
MREEGDEGRKKCLTGKEKAAYKESYTMRSFSWLDGFKRS